MLRENKGAFKTDSELYDPFASVAMGQVVSFKHRYTKKTAPDGRREECPGMRVDILSKWLNFAFGQKITVD